MEQMPRIEFYRQRTFTEKMNATFDFIRENWKPLLKYSFYLIMPICLIQSFAMNSLISGYIGLMDASSGDFDNTAFGSIAGFFANYGIWMLCILIGTAIMSGMIFAMMQTYAVRENKLQDVTLEDFKDLLIRNAWKYIRLIFALVFAYLIISFFAAFVIGLAAIISPILSTILLIPIIILLIVFAIPLMMLVPVYIFERDITFTDAVRKAWKLGTESLWGMLGFIIILYFISSVIQSLTMMPWYIASVVGFAFSLSSDTELMQSVIYKFSLYILGLIQSYGMYASMTIGIIGLAFQYFHSREKVEGVTIESNISNFEEL